MAETVLGRAGTTVVVDLDVCVKTGLHTRQRVTMRGHTTPTWVTVLLLVSVIGYLIAGIMASRRYRVTLPFTRALHDRWLANRRWAWLLGLAGGGAALGAATVGGRYAGVLLGLAIALASGGAIIGTINAMKNNVGFRMSRHHDLIVTRVHPEFARAVASAASEPLTGSRRGRRPA